jgi:hypothetical protein
MVDCFDRIAVQMTEIALEPVRLLADRSMLNSVALRISSGGRKFTIAISKRFAEPGEKLPRYVWSVDEIDDLGELLAGGSRRSLPIGQAFADPETAYWSAVEAICDITGSR